MAILADEDYARKLQEEFDEEVKELEVQTQKDVFLAQKIAAEAHAVSDSDSDNQDISQSEVSALLTVDDEYSTKHDNAVQRNKRPVCQFGADCYRKNPNHLAEFYHPEKSTNSRDELYELEPKRRRASNSTSSFSESDQLSRKSFEDRVTLSHPMRFFLNKIYSVPETQKDWQTLVFPDLLNDKIGTLIESVQLSFMVDLDFVMKFYNATSAKDKPILFVYGELEGSARDYKNVTCIKVNMPFQYGVHHSKMMLFLYKEGLRVVIHTANLVPDDWNEKTQGFWISPLFPSLPDGKKSLLEGDCDTNFKRDLTDYILSYKKPDLVRWSHIIKGHDFSSCNVYFIGSVPGYHLGESRFKYGHMKCRVLIKKQSKWTPRSSYPVIVQCSSIGSLGKDSKSWITGELGASLCGGNETTNSQVNVIYPSEDDVKNSSQGYGGGSCLPYTSATHEKQTWLLNHMHSWRSGKRMRTRSMPHIKTYTRLSSDLKSSQFFLLTSSNLSKAAWGQLQKQGTQLFIRAYEVGVLWLPGHVIGKDSFSLDGKEESTHVNLPYDVPLTKYPSGAGPWFRNTQKSDPDIFGNTYL